MTTTGAPQPVPVNAHVADGRLGALFDVLHDAVIMVRAPDRRIVDANPAALRMFGCTREELVGASTLIIHLDEARFHDVGATVRGVVERGGSAVVELEMRRRDGTRFPGEITISAVGRTIEGGSLVFGIVRDLTAEVKRRAREAFLSEASTLLLRETLHPEETLRAIAKLATTKLSDYASVHLFVADGARVERVIIAHADPTNAALVQAYADAFPPRPHLVHAMHRIGREGALVLNDIDPATVREYSPREGEADLVARLGLKHNLTVALVGRRGIIGALSLTRSHGAPFDAEDIQLAKDLAARAALAYENASLHTDLQDFVETSAIGLHWVGPDGTILWANAADHAFLGYTSDEWVGHDIREFHADAHVIADILARLGRDERLHEYPARLLAKDGSIRHVLIDSSVYWRSGQFVHTRCFTRDVTAQVLAEARSKASEARLGLVLQTAPAQVATLDASGFILTVNRGLRDEDPTPYLGKRAYDTVVDEDRSRVRAIIEETMRTGKAAEYEARGVLATGEVRWVHVRVGALDADGARGAVLVSTDIEERRRAQDEIALMRAQLIQGEKLSALGSLVSGVAHELRTPLTFLSNSAFLLESRLEDAARKDLDARQALDGVKPFVDEIKRGVDRINLLVEDLRRYTKARQVSALTEAPLPALLAEAIELFVATERHAHVTTTALGATRNVTANRGAVQQLVLNLLQNAAEASPAGKTIRVTTRQDGDDAILEVADEGSGIAANVQLRMFDPLFTTKAEGTGLGLSIVKRIADDHQARIEVVSAEGSGTTFRVAFPTAH